MLYFFCFPGHPETDDDEEIEVDVNDDEDEEETSEIDDRESSPGTVAAVSQLNQLFSSSPGGQDGGMLDSPPSPSGESAGEGVSPGAQPTIEQVQKTLKAILSPHLQQHFEKQQQKQLANQNNGPDGVGGGKMERYGCKYCGKTFPRSANLTRHLRY